MTDHEARHDRDEARHSARHDLDDQYDLQQELDRDHRDRADAITRDDVTGLLESVEGLEDAIDGLGGKLDRQWQAGNRKRRRTAWVLAAFTLVWAYGVGAMLDQHVKECMSFGSVPNVRIQRLCNVTVPFHHHPLGGISEEHLREVIERADRIREERAR